jgi:hypothetical protein
VASGKPYLEEVKPTPANFGMQMLAGALMMMGFIAAMAGARWRKETSAAGRGAGDPLFEMKSLGDNQPFAALASAAFVGEAVKKESAVKNTAAASVGAGETKEKGMIVEMQELRKLASCNRAMRLAVEKLGATEVPRDEVGKGQGVAAAAGALAMVPHPANALAELTYDGWGPAEITAVLIPIVFVVSLFLEWEGKQNTNDDIGVGTLGEMIDGPPGTYCRRSPESG